jgi:dCMP deaminase
MLTMRIPRDEVFMAVAQELSSLGTCDRKRVGAVLIKGGRCVSWGYNGAPPGLPHCDENDHGWHDPILPPGIIADKIKEQGCRNATHAEANALAAAARQGISTDAATLYVTVSPCLACAQLLIAAGIVRVVWAETYRDPAGSTLLERAGVEKEVLLPMYLDDVPT